MLSLAPVDIVVVVIITASSSFTTTGGKLMQMPMPKEAKLVECRFPTHGLVLINMSDMSDNGYTRMLHADVSSGSCSGNTFLYGCAFQEDYVTVWAVFLKKTPGNVDTIFCNSSTAVKSEIVHTSFSTTLTDNITNPYSPQISSTTCPPNTALQPSVRTMFLVAIGVPALLVPHILLSP